MPPLPERADINQLRRQARELLRAAQGGDADAISRLTAFSSDLRLSVTQFALAREHGFPSWAALRAEVAQRREPVIRRVATRAELAAAFGAIGAQFEPAITSADRRGADLDRRFDEDQSMMLVVCDPSIAGGALAFRTKNGDVTLRIIGLPDHLRRRGLGRRLVEQLTAAASALGCRSVSVGGITAETRGFYERLGFHGRRSMMRHDL